MEQSKAINHHLVVDNAYYLRRHDIQTIHAAIIQCGYEMGKHCQPETDIYTKVIWYSHYLFLYALLDSC